MKCEQATSLVEKKRDGKLSLSERIGLGIHLGICSICALFYKQAGMLDKAAALMGKKLLTDEKEMSLKSSRKEEMAQALKSEMDKAKL